MGYLWDIIGIKLGYLGYCIKCTEYDASDDAETMQSREGHKTNYSDFAFN